MTADIDRIARRTLSRDERDPKPIDTRYYEALRQWLALYPRDTNFLVDLEAEELVVTCLECFEDIGCGQGRSLLPFKMHLQNVHDNGAPATAVSAVAGSTTSASASPASVRSSTSNSALGGSRRSSTGMKRSPSMSAELEADSLSDAGSERKRARLDSSFDFSNSSFGSYDGEGDISMPDLPADFWEPVNPRTIRSNQTTSNNPRTSTSRFLAALDGRPAASSSKVKPEPVDALIKSEPEDVKLFRDVSNVAGSSHPRTSFKAEIKAELDDKPLIKPEIDPVSAVFARGPSLPSNWYDDDSEDDSSIHLPHVQFPVPVQVAGKGPNLTAFNDFFEQDVVNLAEAATVQTALQKLGLPDLNSKLPGSETRLYPHQVIGVSWMHDLEKNAARRGGILADDMGLGKTAQMIAAMVLNRPPKDQKRRSTLIIVPASLVGQWKLEIENMTERDTFRIFIHHGTTKLKTVKQVAKYDIVITTYATLGQCFDKIERERGKKFDDYIEDETRRSGPLAKTLWWRVVLDEAQYARNRATVASINIASLDSTHRWVLTGTPVTNALMDLYSFVRFLKYHPWSDFTEFNSRIGRVEKRNPQRAGERAQAMLAPIILRRNKDSKIEGEPIIKLGPKTITIRKIQFSARERQIYDALEQRQQQKLQRIIERGRVAKEYQFILVMLLRLRQCANHPQLISKAASEFELNQLKTVEGLGANADPEFELERATILLGEDVVTEMKRKFMLWAKERAGDEANDPEGTECCICLEPYMNNAMVTKCQHRFCDTCIFDIFETGDDGDGGEGAEQPGERPCPTCRTSLTKKQIFAAHAFEPTEDELEEALDAERAQDSEDEDSDAEFRRINKAKTTRRAKGKGKAKAVNDEDFEEEGVVNGINLRELDLGKNFSPSAKMIKMVECLKETEKNSPAERPDKTIIYSQWTSMIDMIQEVLRRENMANLRYDGSMNRVLRDRTIQEFKSRKGPSILIISLKCGGVGLNLTEANHVISLDLAWNSATELQAFDRVHRLGQHLDVTIERLVVENTIEDRILAIQDKKQGLSDAALGEGRATRIKRFSVAELRRLFGMDF